MSSMFVFLRCDQVNKKTNLYKRYFTILSNLNNQAFSTKTNIYLIMLLLKSFKLFLRGHYFNTSLN